MFGVFVTHAPCSLRSVHLATVGTPLQSASSVIVWCLPLTRVEHELTPKQIIKMLVHVKKSVLLVFINGFVFSYELVSTWSSLTLVFVGIYLFFAWQVSYWVWL